MDWLIKHLLYEYSSKIYQFCISTKILYWLFMNVLSYIWKIDACLCNLSWTIIQGGRSSVNSIRVKRLISTLVCFEISVFNNCKIGSKILRMFDTISICFVFFLVKFEVIFLNQISLLNHWKSCSIFWKSKVKGTKICHLIDISWCKMHHKLFWFWEVCGLVTEIWQCVWSLIALLRMWQTIILIIGTNDKTVSFDLNNRAQWQNKTPFYLFVSILCLGILKASWLFLHKKT